MSTTERTNYRSRRPPPWPRPPASPLRPPETAPKRRRPRSRPARSYVGETSVIGREMLEGPTQSEAVLETAFEAQNAAMDAGLSLFDLGLKGNRKAVEQFSDDRQANPAGDARELAVRGQGGLDVRRKPLQALTIRPRAPRSRPASRRPALPVSAPSRRFCDG